MPSDNRVSDGFDVLDGGVNDGIAPSLIGKNQLAFASDITFRGGYAKTRESFSNLPFTFDSVTTQNNFSGIFQGACAYESTYGESGIIIGRGGHLFFLNLSTFVVTEITPQASVLTVQLSGAPNPTAGLSFIVPAGGASVIIPVNTIEPFTIGEHIIIDSGTYVIIDFGSTYIVATYGTGAAHTSVVVGTPVQDSNSNIVIGYGLNPTTFDFVHIFQAEYFAITLAGQNPPIIYDGGMSYQATPNQIPPGIFGIYIWGRIWVVFPNRRNFVAGDLVGSSSGTANASYMDAILNMTENTFLNGGGLFTAPSNRGAISALTELAQVDTSLGTGNLLVGVSKGLFSVNTPTDRTTWQNLSYPIQTISLLSHGPTGPRFTCAENNDIWYRSRVGICSYKNARREINEEGNTPQSHEISVKLLNHDDKALLFYGSCFSFDNRLYFTCSPYRDPNGVAHRGMAVMNLDEVTNLTMKDPPLWEGVYTGLNVLQFVPIDFNDQDKAIAIVLDGTAIEFWELGQPGYYDLFYSTVNSVANVNRTAITPVMETRAFTCGDGDMLKQLLTASIYLDQLADNVTLVIKYRPDQYPTWTTWATINLCANVSQCSVLPANPPGSCVVLQQNYEQYAAKIILPQPEGLDNLLSNRPMTWGYEHQIRIEATGKFRLRKFIIECEPQSQKTTDTSPDGVTCQTVSGCDLPIFTYDSHG